LVDAEQGKAWLILKMWRERGFSERCAPFVLVREGRRKLREEESWRKFTES
jgi:hypothetical protein